MKFTGSVLLAAASLASAQVSYNSTDDSWYCPIANGSYCASDSLSGSIIILCSNGVGQPGDCSGHIQARPPIDVYEAPCWQISPDAGNATCSKNCTVWPEDGYSYDVPGSCSYSQPSNGSDIAGYGLNMTTPTNSTSNSSVTLSTPTPTISASGSPSAEVSQTGSGSSTGATPSSTSNAGVPAHILNTGSSILGLALAVAIAL